MKKICGLHKRKLWLVEYDDFNVITLIHIDAYDSKGDFTEDATLISNQYEKLYHCTPIEAISDIIQEQRIREYLTPETTNEILKLIKNGS